MPPDDPYKIPADSRELDLLEWLIGKGQLPGRQVPLLTVLYQLLPLITDRGIRNRLEQTIEQIAHHFGIAAVQTLPEPAAITTSFPNRAARMQERTQVFISYSHVAAKWLKRLHIHLKPLEREGHIERWDDTRIQAGRPWQEEIRQALTRAKIAVVLVSADFLASDFIAENELPPLLAAAEAEGVRILPVILSPSQFAQSPLARFQAINLPDKPLLAQQYADQEALWVKVADTADLISGRASFPNDRC